MGRLADFFREQSIALDGQKKQKMLSLDREFVDMELRVQTTEAKLLKLAAEVNPLKRDVERLQNEIKQTGSQDHTSLDEVAEKILLAVANGEYSRERIFSNLNVSKVKGDHLFDILAERRLLIYEFGTTTATPLGRAYLIKHDLS